MKHLLVMLMFSTLLVVRSMHAVTIYYELTPFPLEKFDGSVMPQDINIVHLWDGWITNVNYGQSFQRDDRLQVGGWGDTYRTYIKLDLKGLPANVTQAKLWLKNYAREDTSSLTRFAFCKVTGSWSPSMMWSTQPTFGTCTNFNPVTEGKWWIFNITSWFQEWQGGSTNNGIMMYPLANDNHFNVFRSSRYVSGERPALQFEFTPTLSLKMPLPGNHQWLVTNEVGGYECMGKPPWPDTFHADSTAPGNYFSIDFSWKNLPDAGASIYSEESNIPVLAAAGGVIYQVQSSTGNGNFIVIDHDGDMNLNTGFSTRYLHLRDGPPLVQEGQTVEQGDKLGYMGDTGISTGTHLHLGVRYQNRGLSTTPELTKVIMDGGLLKSYQTKCSTNSNGVPTDRIRYYRSSNAVY